MSANGNLWALCRLAERSAMPRNISLPMVLSTVTRRVIVERQIARVVGLILGSIGFGMLMLSALAGQ